VLPGYEAVLWMALAMPAGAPAPVVTRINREMNEILGAADTRDALSAQGLEPEPGTPEAVIARIRADTDKWRGVVAKGGIKAE
jgi:tripartite-type tricarboxylate transporter receptor subunit TctC